MFLKSVELFGFKSFADRTKFEFTDGITSLLGPNGSGKSNVVDSVKWVLGTQSLSAVRAGKREDVIFNGTDTRKPMPMCEVKLTLNNEDGILNFGATEVEIMRRMNRDGENEYFINHEKVLLRNVRELFMDTGVGKAAYSILEQGKIDQILSLKPEDRRYIFEEAAGISKFKVQSEEASRKLQKTDENLAQVEILLKEAEKTYTSRKIQMERVIRRKELDAQKEKLEVELQLSNVQSLKKLNSVREEEKKNAEAEQLQIDNELSSKRELMSEGQHEIEVLKEERDRINIQIHSCKGKEDTAKHDIEFYNEKFSEAKLRTKAARDQAQNMGEKLSRERANYENRVAEYENIVTSLEQTKLNIVKTAEEIEKLEADSIIHETDIEKLQEENESFSDVRLEISKKISELANEIANRLEENIKGSGYSTTLRTKTEKTFFNELNKAKTILNERIEFLKGVISVDFDKNVFLKAIEETDEVLRTELDEIKGLFQEYSGTIPTFLDEFMTPEGTLSKKEDLDKKLQKTYDIETQNRRKIELLKEENDRLKNLLILKKSDLQDLHLEEAQYRTKAESLKSHIQEIKDLLKETELDFSTISRTIEIEESRTNEVLEKIDSTKETLLEIQQRIETLNQEYFEIGSQIDLKSVSMFEQNKDFQEKFDRKQKLIEIIATQNANIGAVNEIIQKTYNDFFDNTGKSLKEFDNHEVTEDVGELKNQLETVKTKLLNLGIINYMAEDEYNEAKKNYDFYSKNMNDLVKAKDDLLEVLEEIKTRSEEMFLETYKQISEAFEEMFKALFGGGRAQLTLSDETNVLESGIEILAQPPGKKLTHLPLLSGGEKALTAVALLFATYKVKPSPFCILDEIDAALDAHNIGAFIQVLKQFDDKSQFIIITHSKHTVMGSNCLLGVTQEELGVSKMVGYKLEDIKGSRNRELK